MSTAADPLATPPVDGRFAVGDGRLLALRCWGSGSPTVVHGGGGSGIARVRAEIQKVRTLAS